MFNSLEKRKMGKKQKVFGNGKFGFIFESVHHVESRIKMVLIDTKLAEFLKYNNPFFIFGTLHYNVKDIKMTTGSLERMDVHCM